MHANLPTSLSDWEEALTRRFLTAAGEGVGPIRSFDVSPETLALAAGAESSVGSQAVAAFKTGAINPVSHPTGWRPQTLNDLFLLWKFLIQEILGLSRRRERTEGLGRTGKSDLPTPNIFPPNSTSGATRWFGSGWRAGRFLPIGS